VSFSLSNLPRVKEIKKQDGLAKRDTIAKCFALIKSQNNVTEIVKNALEVYLENRLNNTSNTNLSYKLFKDNIIELLEYCCNKSVDDIKKEDVLNNEKSILQHLKWCTEYGNTKRLIWIEDDFNVLSKTKDSKSMGKVKVFEDSDEDIYNYFEIRRRLHG